MVTVILIIFFIRYYFRIAKTKRNLKIKINICNFTKQYSLYTKVNYEIILIHIRE